MKLCGDHACASRCIWRSEHGPGRLKDFWPQATSPKAVSTSLGFVRFRCLVFSQAVPIGGLDFGDDLDFPGREQKLFPHFGEAGSAIFLIQEIEYGGHDSLPSFDRLP